MQHSVQHVVALACLPATAQAMEAIVPAASAATVLGSLGSAVTLLYYGSPIIGAIRTAPALMDIAIEAADDVGTEVVDGTRQSVRTVATGLRILAALFIVRTAPEVFTHARQLTTARFVAPARSCTRGGRPTQ